MTTTTGTEIGGCTEAWLYPCPMFSGGLHAIEWATDRLPAVRGRIVTATLGVARHAYRLHLEAMTIGGAPVAFLDLIPGQPPRAIGADGETIAGNASTTVADRAADDVEEELSRQNSPYLDPRDVDDAFFGYFEARGWFN